MYKEEKTNISFLEVSQVRVLIYKILVQMGNVDFFIQCLRFANFNIFLSAMKNVATGRHCTVSRKAKIVSNGTNTRTGVSTFS